MADTNCGRMGRFLRNVFFLRERKLESCITGQVLMLFPIPFRSLKMALLLFAGVTFAQAHQVVMRPGQSVVKALATPGLTKLSVEPGHYFLEEPIVLGPNHKGLEITADGGEVVLSGGTPLSGWRQVEGEENLWAVKNPVAGAIVRQVFHWEKGRMQRSRIPNEGWLRESTPSGGWKKCASRRTTSTILSVLELPSRRGVRESFLINIPAEPPRGETCCGALIAGEAGHPVNLTRSSTT